MIIDTMKTKSSLLIVNKVIGYVDFECSNAASNSLHTLHVI